jgi:hypothetical protein
MRIQGLETFQQYFADFGQHYTLIGGVACYLAMEEAGLEFRATKDLDIVLCAEALTPDFANQFWHFVEAAGYETQEKSEDPQFYRFARPRDARFPVMVELFSRTLDDVQLSGDAHLTPIPMGSEAESLSAILLDGDYYQCIDFGRRVIEGLPILGPEYVLPFKARAWLDMNERKAAGVAVDSRNIKKHRNDVFRLVQLLSPNKQIKLPPAVRQDLGRFVQAMPEEPGLNLKDFGLGHLQLAEVLKTITGSYGLDI